MRIRKATPGDAEAASLMLRRSIRELWVRDHENDPVTLASWLANKTPEKFREWAEAADDFCCVAAGDDGAILGVAYLAKSGEIRLNYVSPDARFQGVSGALIAAMEAQAMRWGLTRLFLKSTATAHRFYLERGYRDAGLPETDRLKDNIYPLVKPLSYRTE
jgi:N-acetylglutamate synthase-like GNAT family acetyltransferase